MRWLRRVMLFVVVVTTMSVFQALVMMLQNGSSDDPQRSFLQVDFHETTQTLGVTSPTRHLLKSPYNCDEEYNNTLGVPDSLSNCAECKEYTCKAFLFGTPTSNVYSKAKTYMQKHPKQKKPDKHFLEISRDCDQYKKTRGYRLQSLSTEEAQFPIAFNILIHKDLEQVERLLRAIYHPSNVYCIHVDANSPKSMQDALRSIVKCLDNVFIASKLEHVVYAGVTRLMADINCMTDLVNSSIQWKYLMNIAGQSFPLMTNYELVQLFTIYNGMNDIEGMTSRVLHGRIDREWIELGKTMNKTGRNNPKPPHDLMIVRGSAYGIFSREFVKFILNDEKARDLLEWSKHTYSPDEHYWATLHHTYSNPHLHTPGGYSGYPDSKPWMAVYAAWGGRDKCYGVWRRGVCVFGVGDLPNLLRQKEAFANKFYEDYQPLALECMDRWIEYKTKCPVPFDYNFYSNMAFVKNKWKFW